MVVYYVSSMGVGVYKHLNTYTHNLKIIAGFSPQVVDVEEVVEVELVVEVEMEVEVASM